MTSILERQKESWSGVAIVEVQSMPLRWVATFTVKYLPSMDQDPGFHPQP